MKTIILLHGMPGQGDQWDEVSKALAPNPVIAPTLEGFSDDWAEEGFPSTWHHARQIRDLVKGKAPDDLVCVAWSFGCHPLLLALSEGLACRQAILFDPSSDTYLEPRERKAFQQDAGAAFGPLFAELGCVDNRRLAELSFAATGSISAWNALDETRRTPFVRGAAALRRAFGSGASPDVLTKEDFARVKTPILVASGENSRAMFKLAADRLNAILPDARRISIKGADHLWPVSRPTAFASLIARQAGDV